KAALRPFLQHQRRGAWPHEHLSRVRTSPSSPRPAGLLLACGRRRADSRDGFRGRLLRLSLVVTSIAPALEPTALAASRHAARQGAAAYSRLRWHVAVPRPAARRGRPRRPALRVVEPPALQGADAPGARPRGSIRPRHPARGDRRALRG